MQRIKLDLDSLDVRSFDTAGPNLLAAAQTADEFTMPDPFCCTGCWSGCGYFPTASSCESGGTDPVSF
jgi:hypothetical protein